MTRHWSDLTIALLLGFGVTAPTVVFNGKQMLANIQQLTTADKWTGIGLAVGLMVIFLATFGAGRPKPRPSPCGSCCGLGWNIGRGGKCETCGGSGEGRPL